MFKKNARKILFSHSRTGFGRRLLPAIFIIAWGALGFSTARADLSADIATAIHEPVLSKATVGIKIVRLGKTQADSTVLYQKDATTPLTPASNLKVVTTSAALEKLGADFSFHTMLLMHNGDLVIIGDGDPTLGDAEMLKKVGWGTETVYKIWAQGLVKRGITSARNVIVDDSVFDQEFMQPHWPADQINNRYVAEVAGLNLNANCVDFYIQPRGAGELVNFYTDPATSFITVKNMCVGGNSNSPWLSRLPGTNDFTLHGKMRDANDAPISITVHDPAMYSATVLSEVLKANGVNVTGTVVRDRTLRAAYEKSLQNPPTQDQSAPTTTPATQGDDDWKLLAIHETPLTSVIARANKDSMNLYAECVCKRLGFAETGTGSWATGTAAVGQFLDSLHIPADQYHLDDGCGLSKQNTVSPNVMVTVLAHDFFSANSKQWFNMLSVAGVDGTLSERFRGSDLRSRVWGKTGFVEGVSCLSGFLHARDDNWYCFSILIKGIPPKSNSGVKVIEEKIVKAIDDYAKASAPDHRPHADSNPINSDVRDAEETILHLNTVKDYFSQVAKGSKGAARGIIMTDRNPDASYNYFYVGESHSDHIACWNHFRVNKQDGLVEVLNISADKFMPFSN